jgi:plasmid stability protein
MEEEVRQILRAAVLEDAQSPDNLADAIARRFADLGGVQGYFILSGIVIMVV